MKNLLLTFCIVGTALFSFAQETTFGARAGIDLATVSVTVPGLGSASSSETGFFVGGFASIGLTESFGVQPEVLYVAIKDFNMVSVPVLGKYSIAENINLLAGPSFNYLLDAEEDEFKVNIDFGGSYVISENIDVQARYSVGMGDVKVSGLFLGVGYTF